MILLQEYATFIKAHKRLTTFLPIPLLIVALSTQIKFYSDVYELTEELPLSVWWSQLTPIEGKDVCLNLLKSLYFSRFLLLSKSC